MAFKNATAQEGLLIDLENFEMAESFHFQFCLKCKNSNGGDKKIKLKLKKKSQAYFFLCDNCKD